MSSSYKIRVTKTENFYKLYSFQSIKPVVKVEAISYPSKTGKNGGIRSTIGILGQGLRSTIKPNHLTMYQILKNMIHAKKFRIQTHIDDGKKYSLHNKIFFWRGGFLEISNGVRSTSLGGSLLFQIFSTQHNIFFLGI